MNPLSNYSFNIIKDQHNNITTINTIIQDKLDGEYLEFDSKTGYLVKKMRFQQGVLCGNMTVYQNNLLQMVAIYENGELSGPMTIFNPETGNITSYSQYDKGVKQGISMDFYPTGSVAVSTFFFNDQKHGVCTNFFPNGAVQLRGCFINGYKEDWWINYDISGNMIQKTFFQRNIEVESVELV